MTTEARAILSNTLCHVDEPTLRRVLAEELARSDELARENEAIKADAGKWIAEQAFVTGIDTGKGLTIGMKGAACSMLAAMMAGEFKGAGGINYVEMTATHPETGPLLFTMQRLAGKTPHQLRAEAVARIEALESGIRGIEMTYCDNLGISDASTGFRNGYNAAVDLVNQRTRKLLESFGANIGDWKEGQIIGSREAMNELDSQ